MNKATAGRSASQVISTERQALSQVVQPLWNGSSTGNEGGARHKKGPARCEGGPGQAKLRFTYRQSLCRNWREGVHCQASRRKVASGLSDSIAQRVATFSN